MNEDTPKDSGSTGDGSPEISASQPFASRALSYPSGVDNEETASHLKMRIGRKTRYFSGGYGASSSAVPDGGIQGTKGNHNRQRLSNRHHNHQGHHRHQCKPFRKSSIYKHRQKNNDRSRNYYRYAKFHDGDNCLLEQKREESVNRQSPAKLSGNESYGDGDAGQAPVGAVTVDTDITYKTFKTKKQVSLPQPASASIPVVLQQAAASASFTASSLVPLSVLSRSLSIFAGSGEKKASDQTAGSIEPSAPSRQSSDGAAAVFASLDDRTAFHQTFSLLVQMGAEASSRRLQHSVGAAVCSAAGPDLRDIGDSSEPSSLRQQQIVQFSDILWIYFQARRYNSNLPCCFDNDIAAWLREQDNMIYGFRMEESSVLDDIVSFRINNDHNAENPTDLVEIDRQNSVADSCISPVNNGDSVGIHCQLVREQKAMEAIADLLARYEHFQTLYKSSKAMETALGEQFTPEIKKRLNILYGWSNIASDLRRKLTSVADMLEVRKYMYKSRRESLILNGSTDAISRSASSDLGPIEEIRELSLASPSVKNVNDAVAFLSPPKTPTTASLFRTTSAGSTSSAVMLDILPALADTDYLKSYAERCLKLRGMRKVLCRVAVIYGQTLWRARQILQRRCTMTPLASFWKLGDASDCLSSPFLRLCRSTLLECETDLARCHVEDDSYRSMALPEMFPIYFVLLRVPLDLVYVWLNLRLSQTTSREPDRMTTKQLIQDARDCLEAATEVKTFYQDYVQAVVDDAECLERLLVNDMRCFEEALREMFELYLRYVHRWVEYQCMAGVGTRGVSREQNQMVLKYLEGEWKFAKRISVNVLFGEAEAAQKFCHMNTAILKNMEELLENSLDETFKRQYEDECKSENGRHNENELDFYSSSSLSSSDDEQAAGNCYGGERTVLTPIVATSPVRKSSSVFEQCRRLKTIVKELRNLANRSVGLAKRLRQDLEIATKFGVVGSPEDLIKRLQETGHYLVRSPRNVDVLILCNSKAARNESILQLLLNVACGRDDRFNQTISPRQVVKYENGYILLIGGVGLQSFVWNGPVKEIVINADSSLALQHMDIDGVYLVMGDSGQLREHAVRFLTYLGTDCLTLVDEQCSCHSVVAENMNEMKICAAEIRQRLADWLKNVAVELKQDNPLNEMEEAERQTYRDTLIQAYGVAFEYHRELMRLLSTSSEKEMARNMADFAMQWCQLITGVCGEGQGCRPRWAADGINYLVQVADPRVTAYLDNNEFQDLKRAMHMCLNHIIGSRPLNAAKTSLGGHRISLLDASSLSSGCPSRNSSRVNLSTLSSESKLGARSSPSSARNSRDDLQSESLDNDTQSRRVMRIVNRQEYHRDEKLRKEYKLIGRCVDRSEVNAEVQMPLKRAGFRWQRLQHFVGRGRWGSVHTALNLDTGQLMAVKQMKLNRKQDHQAMQHLMDEVTNFSKIQHANLVRYFGAEVYQDEILIFMEYCNEGTLAEACKDGMSEELVRFYTLSLLHAVGELHKHNIVHRDIKPANIFLANEHKSLKLGDFGSSVRLAGDETAVGELTMYIGTPAYMAPEVCTCAANGYGRAADIWSLGCVVLEMMTGKAPWHDLPESLAIVYRVGTGGIPDIPSCVGSSCLEFLQHCLQSKSTDRWVVDRLLELPFVKV